MRKARILGLALMAIFALGAVTATTALAKEPSGLLFLPGQTGPVTFKGSSTTAEPLLKVEKDRVACTSLEFSGSLGKEKNELEHATLGSLTVTYTGCKETEKVSKCSSENAKGEKDPAETILQLEAGTDAHTVSLENAKGELAPGLLVGLLSVEGKPLTLNCGLIKVEVLGSAFLEVKGAKEGTDVETVEVKPNPEAKCDKEDALCKKELEAWGVAGSPSGLGGKLATTEFNATFTANPTKVTFSKDVLLDF